MVYTGRGDHHLQRSCKKPLGPFPGARLCAFRTKSHTELPLKLIPKP